MHVAAQTRRQIVDDDLEGAAHRVAGLARLVDLRDHLLLDGRVGAVQRRILGDRARLGERDGQWIGQGRRPDAHDVADDLGADAAQQLAGDRADGDARGGFPRAGTLEDVAHVLVPVFHEAGQIGVAGARSRDRRSVGADGAGRHLGLRVHRPLPVLPVLVGDHQRDRPTGAQAVADAAERLGAVRFDQHPAAAAVTGLAPAQVGGDGVDVDGKTGRHAFDDGDERLAVRLAGGQKTQHAGFILSEKIASSGPRSRDRPSDPRGRVSCTAWLACNWQRIVLQ